MIASLNEASLGRPGRRALTQIKAGNGRFGHTGQRQIRGGIHMQDAWPSRRKTPASGVPGRHPLGSDVIWRLPDIDLKSLFADDRFRIVPETMVDGLIVIDTAGVIQYVNRGCESLFKYSAGELIGKNVSTLMPHPYASAHDGFLHRHRETRVNRIIGIGRELTGLKADGTVFPMYLSVGEAETASGVIFVGIIYDLTEKKRAEEMIVHHQKLDAIGQLSGGIAHDFNNILAVIGGNLEMIANVDMPPAARRAVARAQDAALRAARITQRLLAFARKQPLRREPLDLNTCLEDMAEMLQRTIGQTVDVRLHLAPDLGPVEADIDQFETAILNLCVNARDAMPNGGAIEIETEAVRFDDDPHTAQEAPPGEYVRVSVSDNGVGMSPEVCARAIEPFFTTKEVGAGTGLGLSMVYGFMKQLGGHARLYSEVDRGTRVSLFFPRSGASTSAKTSQENADTPEGEGETILVVDDDPDVRLVTVSRLKSLGYDVEIAEDGAGALETIKRAPKIDLALVDVVMPGGMDGHALADEIEKRHPHIRTVLTSGYSPRMASGAQLNRPFLPKPSTRAQLAQTIRRALQRKP
jgi:PAS domain S-box-containing protein